MSMMIRQACSVFLPSEDIRLCSVRVRHCRPEFCEIAVYVAEISPAGYEGVPVLVSFAAAGIVEYMSQVAMGIYTHGLAALNQGIIECRDLCSLRRDAEKEVFPCHREGPDRILGDVCEISHTE